jgi:hypothetical protein
MELIMNSRILKIVLSLVVGAVGVAIGLYFGRFVSAPAGLLFASSRQAIPLATGITGWAFIGFIGGLGLAFTAVSRHRARFVLVSILGFALGGLLAALPEAIGRADRNSTLAVLALPLGGALAGLLLGLGAQLRTQALLTLIAGAAAMAIGGPFIGPQSSVIPPADWVALLLPGAIIGATVAVLAPVDGSVPPA